ncbi:hypothetical protein EYZ11_006332 [Aspergillus tanneri]|uniref:LysM domain-containing protein n=1 Tax=Aspergillus tanneri TaxID=1220188 RepID=A0A4S3JLL4_9EURO|nr:hypothetical protein EYZ11_006332 [Aspergillus tanneri]
MAFKSFLVLGLFLRLLPGRGLDQSVFCSYSMAASNGDTCQSFATSWGITLANFELLNPYLRCSTLVVGRSYCVIGSVSSATTKSTTTTTSTTSITSFKHTATGSSLPSPTKFGITAAQLFAAWNPSINAALAAV